MNNMLSVSSVRLTIMRSSRRRLSGANDPLLASAVLKMLLESFMR